MNSSGTFDFCNGEGGEEEEKEVGGGGKDLENTLVKTPVAISKNCPSQMISIIVSPLWCYKYSIILIQIKKQNLAQSMYFCPKSNIHLLKFHNLAKLEN